MFECGDICIADGYNTFVTYGTQPRIGPGNRIALAQAFPSAIVLFDTDDGSSVTVASGTGTFSEPALSPDGSKVVYAFKPAGTNQKYVIRRVNADGSGLQTLTSTAYNSRRPDWSPDGAKIVFTTDNGGDSEIAVMNADGSGLTALTANTASDIDPRWSPDGTQIAFSSTRDGNPELYRMSANGTNVVRLTNNPVSDVEPAWSPDGTQIVFASNRSAPGATSGSVYQLFTLRASDGGQVALAAAETGYLPGWRSPDWGMIVAPPPGCPEGTCLIAPTEVPEE